MSYIVCSMLGNEKKRNKKSVTSTQDGWLPLCFRRRKEFKHTAYNIQHTTYGIRHTQSKARGFTLVEMIVALGFFTVVMLVAISVLASISGANEKARTIRIVIDNLNFAVENMARTLRVGSRYQCNEPSCPAAGSSFIAFRNFQAQTGPTEVWSGFKWEEDYLGDGVGVIFRSNECTNGLGETGCQNWLRITASEIDVDSLKFYVKDPLETDGGQAQALIIARGTAGKGEIRTDFDIQTTVTQRLADS